MKLVCLIGPANDEHVPEVPIRSSTMPTLQGKAVLTGHATWGGAADCGDNDRALEYYYYTSESAKSFLSGPYSHDAVMRAAGRLMA
jgi:hypothetical protein